MRELARRDARAIRGGIVLACIALALAVLGLFTNGVIGGVAAVLGLLVQANSVVRWLGGPRWMPERRLVLAPGVVAGIPLAMGSYEAFGAAAAFLVSLVTAFLVTIVLGMTIAARRA
jgi:Na+/pantothenate symporter